MQRRPLPQNFGVGAGILDFVGDQSKLDSILANLDKVQADAYK